MTKQASLSVVRAGGRSAHQKQKDPPGEVLPYSPPKEPKWLERFPTPPGLSVNDPLRKENLEVRAVAQEAWHRWVAELEKLGRINAAYSDCLTEAATCVARIWQCERDISRRGVTVPSSFGSKALAMNRSITAANQYRAALKAYIILLGIAPNAALIPKSDAPDDDGVWD